VSKYGANCEATGRLFLPERFQAEVYILAISAQAEANIADVIAFLVGVDGSNTSSS
jgi:hypothetical protein